MLGIISTQVLGSMHLVYRVRVQSTELDIRIGEFTDTDIMDMKTYHPNNHIYVLVYHSLGKRYS